MSGIHHTRSTSDSIRPTVAKSRVVMFWIGSSVWTTVFGFVVVRADLWRFERKYWQNVSIDYYYRRKYKFFVALHKIGREGARNVPARNKHEYREPNDRENDEPVHGATKVLPGGPVRPVPCQARVANAARQQGQPDAPRAAEDPAWRLRGRCALLWSLILFFTAMKLFSCFWQFLV